jgi:hypothetical protein
MPCISTFLLLESAEQQSEIFRRRSKYQRSLGFGAKVFGIKGMRTWKLAACNRCSERLHFHVIKDEKAYVTFSAVHSLA